MHFEFFNILVIKCNDTEGRAIDGILASLHQYLIVPQRPELEINGLGPNPSSITVPIVSLNGSPFRHHYRSTHSLPSPSQCSSLQNTIFAVATRQGQPASHAVDKCSLDDLEEQDRAFAQRGYEQLEDTYTQDPQGALVEATQLLEESELNEQHHALTTV